MIATNRSLDKAAALRASGVEPVIVDVVDKLRLHSVVADAQPVMGFRQVTDHPPCLDRVKMAEAIIRTVRIHDTGTRNLLTAAVAARVTRMAAGR